MPVFVVIYLKECWEMAICETYISRTFPKKAEPYNIAQPHNAVHAEYEYDGAQLDLDSIIFECHVRCVLPTTSLEILSDIECCYNYVHTITSLDSMCRDLLTLYG